MQDHKQAPAWLPYPLLTVLLAGFVFIAFLLMETARAMSVWMLTQKGALQSIDYIVLALYCVGVLVCLPLLERALSRRESVAAMVALALATLGWQCAAYGGLTLLNALSPVGEWRLAVALLPVGVVITRIPFVRRGR